MFGIFLFLIYDVQVTLGYLLGPLIVTGAGMGFLFSATASTGTFGVAPRDAGIASASYNTGQQLGGSIGTAPLNTIAASATTSYLGQSLARAPHVAAGPLGSGPRLHHGVLVVREHLRGRRRQLRRAAAPRPADLARGHRRPGALPAGCGGAIVTRVMSGLLGASTAPSASAKPAKWPPLVDQGAPCTDLGENR